jgi:hypothetical protein
MSEYPFYLPDPLCATFFISKDQVCIKRNPFQVHRSSEGKSDRGNEAMRKGPEDCSQQWKIGIEQCIGLGGDHFEHDNTSIM